MATRTATDEPHARCRAKAHFVDPIGTDITLIHAARAQVDVVRRRAVAPFRVEEGADGSSAQTGIDLTPALPAIPDYELIRLVHRGGQAVVYEAIQQATGRRVALKVVRSGPLSSPEE